MQFLVCPAATSAITTCLCFFRSLGVRLVTPERKAGVISERRHDGPLARLLLNDISFGPFLMPGSRCHIRFSHKLCGWEQSQRHGAPSGNGGVLNVCGIHHCKENPRNNVAVVSQGKIPTSVEGVLRLLCSTAKLVCSRIYRRPATRLPSSPTLFVDSHKPSLSRTFSLGDESFWSNNGATRARPTPVTACRRPSLLALSWFYLVPDSRVTAISLRFLCSCRLVFEIVVHSCYFAPFSTDTSSV